MQDALEQIVEGTYSSGKLSGFGTIVFSRGGKFEGEFKNGKAQGEGIATAADGKITEGLWDQGNFVKEATVNLNLKDAGRRPNEQSLSNNDLKSEQRSLKPDQLKKKKQYQRFSCHNHRNTKLQTAGKS